MFTFSQWVDLLVKARGHKYIKRIPYNTPKGRRYRYIYNVTHSHQGKHAMDESHLKVGTAFMVHTESGAEVHGHIKSINGDRVTYVLDDGADKGKEVTKTRAEIVAMLNEKHNVSEQVSNKRDQLKQQLQTARDNNASEKQLNRIQERIDRLGGEQSTTDETQSLLQEFLIHKHSVTREMIERRKKTLDLNKITGARRSAPMLRERLDVLERDGVESAITSYNEMLKRSADDNKDVLKAILDYQELITAPFSDAESLNKIANAKAENVLYISDRFDLPVDVTHADAKAKLSKEDLRAFVSLVRERTGVRIVGTRLTLLQACEHLPKNGSVTRMLKEARAESEPAKQARERIKKHIEKVCAEFSVENNPYKEGEVHAQHKKRTGGKSKNQREIISYNTRHLAFVEDLFQRAYPERKQHKTTITATGDARAYAEMDDLHKSTVYLTAYSSRIASHELAHTLEGRYDTRAPYQQRIQEASTLTHLTRTKGSADVDLYGDRGEYALEDKYMSAYTGKLYSDGSTELITTGVERFFGHPDKPDMQMSGLTSFAIFDPHHYLVTYGILKGYAK